MSELTSPSIEKIRRFIPPIVSMAMFMEAIDTTIINTAIPKMADSFHVPPVDLKIALIGYLVSLAIFIPISGWCADKLGVKKVFLYALTLFTLSSLACGLSTNLKELIFWRIVQGVGGSFMMPLGRLMIIHWYEKTELVQTMNRVVIPALIGPALGPLLGGIITQYISWHWIFWVNIPVGILSIIFAYYGLPNDSHKKSTIPTHPLDKTGFVLFGLGLGGFTFGLSALSEDGMALSSILPILLISLLLFILYFFHSKKQTYPIVDSRLFSVRLFRLAILGNMITRLGVGALPFLLPLMLQTKLNYSPSFSGLLLAFTAIGMVMAKLFARKLLRFFGFKNILLLNTGILGGLICLFGTISHSTNYSILTLLMVLFGLLMSLQFSSMNPLIFSEIEHKDSSSATSIQSTTMQLSQSFGVALCAIVLKQLEGNFTDTFLITGIITIISSFIFLRLKKEDGKNLL